MEKDEDFWKEINADKIAKYKLWKIFLNTLHTNFVELLFLIGFCFVFFGLVILPMVLFIIKGYLV